MGCFPACFGHLRRKTTKKVQDQCLSHSYEHQESFKLLPDITESQKEEEEIAVKPTKLISESEAKCKEHMDIHNEEKSIFEHSKVMNDTNEVASRNSDKLVENENGEVKKESEEGREDESDSKNSRRIQDSCLINDKEYAAMESKEVSLQCSPVQEESCSSLFSLSIDSRKHLFAAEKGEKEVSSTPLKMNYTSFKYPLKKDPSIEQPFEKSKPFELAVETSLSSWLVEPGKSPQKLSVGNSPESEKNYGDDQAGGVGTVGRYWRQRGIVGEGEEVRAIAETLVSF